MNTSEQRTAAVDEARRLIATEGLSSNQAAARIGVSYGVTGRSVQRWAEADHDSLGDSSHAAAKQARTVATDQYAALRARMRVLASTRALEALEDMPNWQPRDRQALAMVFAILLDKVRLEEGKVSGRTEVVSVDAAAQPLRRFVEETEEYANTEAG